VEHLGQAAAPPAWSPGSSMRCPQCEHVIFEYRMERCCKLPCGKASIRGEQSAPAAIIAAPAVTAKPATSVTRTPATPHGTLNPGSNRRGRFNKSPSRRIFQTVGRPSPPSNAAVWRRR
jgi:hypothetical protein